VDSGGENKGTEGRTLRGKWRDGRRVVDRECIGERPTQEQCEVEGSCSKPRLVCLTL